MSQEPRYEVYRFRDDIKALQEKAIVEVLTSSPSGGQLRLYSYGLDNSCEELSDGVIRGMGGPLSKWASHCGLVINDLDRPTFRSEVFRLQRGSAIWPGKNSTALLVPLSNGNAMIDLLPRGSRDRIAHDWDPRTILHLNEMGFEFQGNGSVRFMYILFQTASRPGFYAQS
ncbi:hypothetical protein FPSE_08237 [Fusarium pseudograminearum CS3096]|uniref:Uncharacterized protein n=1 Tax=Fusarium pseudograminearum (strain CS3096) TaxID=1028729 RepID=K3VFJ7_FUSPC|nr:hypothetical protein FPSE_08237 [Fusarium pseudograminearum CS3096]EKJ71598.1 hypothetical protein FPSE_08237 [Fusarium pseudograminearum CS3096]KAF0638130.1 hypothetical protein FPSE5266_08237 [Fusarium pseudograminearum]